MAKLKTIPSVNNMGVFSHILPRHIVPSAARNMIPVGIDINSVRTMNGPCSSLPIPLVNRWCAQTMKLMATMANRARTTHL